MSAVVFSGLQNLELKFCSANNHPKHAEGLVERGGLHGKGHILARARRNQHSLWRFGISAALVQRQQC